MPCSGNRERLKRDAELYKVWLTFATEADDAVIKTEYARNSWPPRISPENWRNTRKGSRGACANCKCSASRLRRWPPRPG